MVQQTENEFLRLNALLEKRVQEHTAHSQTLALELTQAEERERRRLAEALHDQLQQLLFGAKLHLNPLHAWSTGLLFQEQLSQVENLLTESIELCRSLAHELCPPVLHSLGLAAGLKWLGRWMKDKHGLKVVLTLEEPSRIIDLNLQLWLFQAVRELLFNVVKHARVTTAQLIMKPLPGQWIEIVVSDQGVGCKAAQLTRSGAGFGLQNIRERLELFGGQLQIESAPGRGSRFTLLAPMQLPQGEAGLVGPNLSPKHRPSSARTPRDSSQGYASR